VGQAGGAPVRVLGQFWTYVSTGDNWWGVRGIARGIYDHLRLSLGAVAVAAVLAVPLAMALGHTKRGGFLASTVVNIGRAIPSFAIIALLFPLSLAYGFGLGFWPTFVALVLLAIPPMFTNTYAGVRDVDPGVVEASRGMGMTPREVLFSVEVPNAMPLIVTGLRVATVQVIATATLSALVAFRGLGDLIIGGKAQRNNGKLLTGAVLVALLAILAEIAFGVLERALTPWARTSRASRRTRDVTITPELDPTST
jgi:osmoprotectant transport system permease protein